MPENESPSKEDDAGVEGAQTPSTSSEVRLSREMRLIDITMIGAGIIGLTGGAGYP